MNLFYLPSYFSIKDRDYYFSLGINISKKLRKMIIIL